MNFPSCYALRLKVDEGCLLFKTLLVIFNRSELKKIVCLLSI